MASKTKEIKVEGITRSALERLCDHWDKFAGCYFWTPSRCASQRRAEEKRQSRDDLFSVNGVAVQVSIAVTCSCRNYYCARSCYVGGVKKVQGGRYLKSVLAKGTFPEDAHQDGQVVS